MEPTTVLWTIFAAIVYSLFYYISKRMKGEKFSWKKFFRTVLIGIVIGGILAYQNRTPTIENVQALFVILVQYAGFVAVVDKLSTIILKKLNMPPDGEESD